MKRIEDVLRYYTFEKFSEEQHKMFPVDFFKEENIVCVDVRSREEMETVKFPLKTLCPVLEIPVYEIPDRINEIPKDKLVGIMCAASLRATWVFLYLKAMGFDNVKILRGGYEKLFEVLKPGPLKKAIADKK